ncbi:MAG: ABC transporter permease [Nanoarchaeota archaeon]|nr:ABC transporter permease [Nanoarchaeota archaeon]
MFQLKKGGDKTAIGYNYQFKDKIFKKAVKLGDKIKINCVPFEVIGFYEEIDNPSDDANVYLTDKAMERFTWNDNIKGYLKIYKEVLNKD